MSVTLQPYPSFQGKRLFAMGLGTVPQLSFFSSSSNYFLNLKISATSACAENFKRK